jgi:hypothetical protein
MNAKLYAAMFLGFAIYAASGPSFAVKVSAATPPTPGYGTSYADCLSDRDRDHMACIMEWKKSEAEAVAQATSHLEACNNVVLAYSYGKYDAAAVRPTYQACFKMIEYMNRRWSKGFPQ